MGKTTSINPKKVVSLISKSGRWLRIAYIAEAYGFQFTFGDCMKIIWEYLNLISTSQVLYFRKEKCKEENVIILPAMKFS